MHSKIKRFKSGFTMAPNELITDKRVKAVAFRLWCLLNSKPEDWIFKPDVLMDELGVKSSDTFYKHRKDLIKYGYVKVTENKKEDGTFDSTIYELTIPEKVDDGTVPQKNRDGKNGVPKNRVTNNKEYSNKEKDNNKESAILFENSENDPKKATVFSESMAANEEVFKNMTLDICQEHNLEWELLYEALDAWSENNPKKKRTAKGWILSIKRWVRSDAVNGTLAQYRKQQDSTAINDTFRNMNIEA